MTTKVIDILTKTDKVDIRPSGKFWWNTAILEDGTWGYTKSSHGLKVGDTVRLNRSNDSFKFYANKVKEG